MQETNFCLNPNQTKALELDRRFPDTVLMSTANQKPLAIFSDLDGTLLDHRSYSFAPAQDALAEAARGHVPVILASSKTAAEIAPLRSDLGLEGWPAIVENGAGLLPAGASDACDGRQAENVGGRQDVLRRLESLPIALRKRFAGFTEWGTAEIARRTGLSMAEAERANTRAFSEPGEFTGDSTDFAHFVAALAERGVQAQRGGRFVALSLGADKAQRMREVLALLGFASRAETYVLALGDGENDIAMLEFADLGVVIANPAHAPLPRLASEQAGRILRTRSVGPAGWNACVLAVLRAKAGL